MRFDRRDLFKFGAAGLAGALTGVDAQAGQFDADRARARGLGQTRLTLRIRGLCLIAYRADSSTAFIGMVDAAKYGMPAHTASLIADPAAIDTDATSLPVTKVLHPGTPRERWLWDLQGKDVKILEDALDPDLDADSSNPPGSRPILGNWRSLKWVPNINDLTGATKISEKAAFTSIIELRHGRIQGEKPRGRVGRIAMWDFRKPSGAGGGQISHQLYTDTALYTRTLNGRTPVISIGTGKVVLVPNTTADVAFDNLAPDPTVNPGTRITIGHFPALYEVVQKVYVPDYSVLPTDLPACTGCETDPVFCPPAWGQF